MYHAGGWVPQSPMEGLTPASADDLPPLGELLVDDPFWQYPAWGLAREGVGHLRVWATATASPGYLAVVTETGGLTSVTESAGRIWAGLARRYRPSLVLLEHHPAPEFDEGMETLDLVRIGADGSPHWSRVWPTPEENPRHAGLELWMAAYGHPIVGRPASWFDRRPASVPRPGMGGSALSRSANVAAGGPPAARRPRRTGTAVGDTLAACAAVCAAVIATVMASRDVTA